MKTRRHSIKVTSSWTGDRMTSSSPLVRTAEDTAAHNRSFERNLATFASVLRGTFAGPFSHRTTHNCIQSWRPLPLFFYSLSKRGWLDIVLKLMEPRNMRNESSTTPSHEPPLKIQRHKHWLATITSTHPSRDRTHPRPNRSPAAHASKNH